MPPRKTIEKKAPAPSVAKAKAPARGSRVNPGDATGRERDRLAREHAPAIKEAATRTTLVTGPPPPEPGDDVVDYSGGGLPMPGNEGGVPVVSTREALGDGRTQHTAQDLPEGDVDLEGLPDGKTDVRPREPVELDEPPPAARFGGARQGDRRHPRADDSGPTTVEPAYKMMRVNTDLEDVTIGKDNHFTFREGTSYKVPAYVYDHLDEKGYVRH